MSKVIHIKTENEGKILSKLQKQFNNYIKKINSLKTEIGATKEILERVNQAISKDFSPLEKKEFEIRVEIMKTLDRWFDSGKLKKNDRETLSEYIAIETFSLITNGHEDLKPLYEKHAEQTFEEANEEANEAASDMMKSMFEMYGMDFEGKIDMNNPQEIMAQLEEQMKAKDAAAFEKERTKPKTAKQLEKEEKKRLAENQLSKSIKDVYTKLVKAFHPDREPNEVEKVRKTEIMTKITESYNNGDLLALLQLQLEYEQINEDSINSLADEQLKHYNKVLKEQVDTLQEELMMMNGAGNPMHPFNRLNIRGTDNWLVQFRIDNEIKRLKKFNKELESDLKTLKSSIEAAKEWLKIIRRSNKQKEKEMDFDFLGDMFR